MVTRSRFILVLVAWCTLSLLAVTTASAALVPVGTVTYDSQICKLIYDEEQDITWLDYTKSSALWATQDTWAQGLSFTIGGVTYADWRLPRVTDTAHALILQGTGPVSDAQKNSSEMAYLYYNQLGGVHGVLMTNYFPFEHIQQTLYWLETPGAGTSHWVFYMSVGYQSTNSGSGPYALAVHEGRVVPLPGSALLLASGLLGLLALRHRHRNSLE